MASLQVRDGRWQCQFLFQGKRHTFALGRVSESEAHSKADQVDYLLMRLGQGVITLPAGVDLVAYMRHDGAARPAQPPKHVDSVTLASLRDAYLDTHGNGTLEANTLRGIHRHFKHLVRELGDRFPIRELALQDLQRYVDKRTRAKGKRGRLNPVTIKKEIVTLRTAWNWGLRMGLVQGRYPYDGLRYPKSDDKPPFQNREQIQRQAPGLPAAKVEELWESLYLSLPEIQSLLDYVKGNARYPWIYPMVATAAHTGARKGELLKMRIGDLDFVAGVVSIQERKRARGRRTTRSVPLSSSLAAILKEWLSNHPGGQLLFAQEAVVPGSRKRRRTARHSSQSDLSEFDDGQGRVQLRVSPGLCPLTEHEAHWHFKQTLKGSEWSVIHGFHALRHSFISALASSGVDQRMIDEMVGHQSEEQRRRYRHLYPAAIKEALRSVFG
jgi:integrase